MMISHLRVYSRVWLTVVRMYLLFATSCHPIGMRNWLARDFGCSDHLTGESRQRLPAIRQLDNLIARMQLPVTSKRAKSSLNNWRVTRLLFRIVRAMRAPADAAPDTRIAISNDIYDPQAPSVSVAALLEDQVRLLYAPPKA